jgi:hypothetical protein
MNGQTIFCPMGGQTLIFVLWPSKGQTIFHPVGGQTLIFVLWPSMNGQTIFRLVGGQKLRPSIGGLGVVTCYSKTKLFYVGH